MTDYVLINIISRFSLYFFKQDLAHTTAAHLVLHFYEIGGVVTNFKKVVKESKQQRKRYLVPSMSQTPKTLAPTVPIMQLDSIFH